MIRVYLLPLETINGTQIVAGSLIIHDALLDCTADPDIRKLIMYTTPEEHHELTLVALETPETTQEDIDRYNSQVIIYEPDPDTERAEELLSCSPEVITPPQQWELLRIIGHRLGYRFD